MMLSTLILLITTFLAPSALTTTIQSWYTGQLQVSAPGNLCSLDNGLTIHLNSDGNLAVFRTTNPLTIIWNAQTSSPKPGSTLYFQTDGNLVIYDASSVPLWQSGTAGRGARMACYEIYPYFEIFNAEGRLIWYPQYTDGVAISVYTYDGCPYLKTEPWLCVA
ncbi:MAG: hypothetical protein Q9170_003456 [Blastenia crenularia]